MCFISVLKKTMPIDTYSEDIKLQESFYLAQLKVTLLESYIMQALMIIVLATEWNIITELKSNEVHFRVGFNS